MTEYTAGDLVEAVKGESVIRGRLKADELGLHLWVGDSGRTPENIESYGFTISIIEKAAAVVVLPTEPGAIICWENPYYTGLAVLEKTDQWLYRGVILNCQAMAQEINNFPFTRLEPVSETAKKVLDRVAGMWPMTSRDMAKIAADFGAEL